MQQQLFEALPPQPKSPTRVNARTYKRRVTELENIISAADATIENSAIFTQVCREHLGWHRAGRVDNNWIDGALRDGLFDIEDGFRCDGRYTRRQVRQLKSHKRDLGLEAVSWREPRGEAVRELGSLKRLMAVAA